MFRPEQRRAKSSDILIASVRPLMLPLEGMRDPRARHNML